LGESFVIHVTARLGRRVGAAPDEVRVPSALDDDALGPLDPAHLRHLTVDRRRARQATDGCQIGPAPDCDRFALTVA
jgi:hypothetical protein